MAFEGYSERAKHVIFVARHIAGRYGSSRLDLNHVLVALIYEDQGEVWKPLSDVPELQGLSKRFPAQAHRPYLPSDVASSVLHRLEGALPRGKPLPSSTDVPMSPDLKETLGTAAGLRERFGQEQVEPLHILAAALADESNPGVAILRQAGITPEKVLDAMRPTGEK